jgi:hypothetical protein
MMAKANVYLMIGRRFIIHGAITHAICRFNTPFFRVC